MSNRTAEQDVACGKFENFFTSITHGSSESFDPAVRRGKLSISALLQQLNSPPRSFLIITARLSDSICVLSLFLTKFPHSCTFRQAQRNFPSPRSHLFRPLPFFFASGLLLAFFLPFVIQRASCLLVGRKSSPETLKQQIPAWPPLQRRKFFQDAAAATFSQRIRRISHFNRGKCKTNRPDVGPPPRSPFPILGVRVEVGEPMRGARNFSASKAWRNHKQPREAGANIDPFSKPLPRKQLSKYLRSFQVSLIKFSSSLFRFTFGLSRHKSSVVFQRDPSILTTIRMSFLLFYFLISASFNR